MSERAGAQPHFIGLCKLLAVAQPDDAENYTFEKGTLKLGAKRGFADVFKRGAFAWEYKAPNGDLQAALRQLKDYANALDNPPLLVVSDRLRIEIYTQFIGRPTETIAISIKQLADPAQLEILRRVFESPQSFEPKRTNRDITEEAAKAFADVAERMRNERQIAPERVAHFLTQCLFCFFAEDVGLLPDRLFEILVAKQTTPEKLRDSLIELFTKMRDGGSLGRDEIPWFNGGLFKTIDVPEITPADIKALRTASQLNWSAIDVAIVGTLFERGLNPKKRSQLGAHYTDPATIMRIVTPVVERPLRAEWAVVREEIESILTKSKKYADAPFKRATDRFNLFLEKLRNYRVLDPACGSGNFLYLALKTLKNIEHSVHLDVETLQLNRPVDLVVSPANVLGIEINEYAAELARVTVWIGDLQWRLQHGYPIRPPQRSNGDYEYSVLSPLDHIEHRDALLSASPSEVSPQGAGRNEVAVPSEATGEGNALAPNPSPTLSGTLSQMERGTLVEAAWPRADAVIGNPPFVGGSKKRRELGDDYFEALARVYAARVPAGADLVCYWFDKAWQQMLRKELTVAGLVATQSIRSGSNRTVLDAIVKNGVIFDAWSDEPWVNDGAAVRVSLVAFGKEGAARLNGDEVARIAADLESSSGGSVADVKRLAENFDATFEGTKKYGDFDIRGELARRWLRAPNPNGGSNFSIMKPWRNGNDLTARPSDTWIIDFGVSMRLEEAALFDEPFRYAEQSVKAKRVSITPNSWWLHERPRPALRIALQTLPRYIVTPRVAKHRFFVWLDKSVLPDTRLNVVARADDATFGLLSSRIHVTWALANASLHGDGDEGGRPTYNAKSCFETFPFPEGLTPRNTAHQRTETLEDGAVIPLFDTSPSGRGRDEGAGEGKRPTPKTSPALSGTLSQGEREHLRDHAEVPTRDDSTGSPRTAAIAIACAAKRLNDLRERWLNPPEWTERVPEVTPLGMDASPYPDRILPRANLGATELAELKKRTLTNLYNQLPAWLADAHSALDVAVAVAYGWADYTSAMSDNEILSRLLKLNQARSVAPSAVRMRR